MKKRKKGVLWAAAAVAIVAAVGILFYIGGRKQPLGEEELLNIMEEVCGYPIIEHVYTDMDRDGAAELLGVYLNEEAYSYHTWYCSSDGEECYQIQENLQSYDECALELLPLDGETHVAINAYNLMGNNKNHSIAVLRDGKAECLVTNEYGTVKMDAEGNILLNIESYDAYYDGDCWTGHTWKDTYLYYDGAFYKEYGATEISEETFLQMEGGQALLSAIREKWQRQDTNIEFSFYLRSNHILHIQCALKEADGGIRYFYYTLKWDENKITGGLENYYDGQMGTSFSMLEVTY